MSHVALKLATNLAEYPVTRAIRDGRVSSDVVALDCCGPKQAHDGFKAMLRENKYDARELAIVTYLQARAYGKPYVMIPIPISGRFQHKTVAYNSEFGELTPKDIEGRQVGVRAYAQTTKILPPIGLEANHKALEMAIQYAYEQKVIPRRLSVDELFDETTAALTAAS